MPSWSDGDSSTLGRLSSSNGTVRRIVEDTPDSEFRGIDFQTALRCGCNCNPARYVAFEGTDVGRRYHGCPKEKAKCCPFHSWQDGPWPEPLQRGLMKLWWQIDDVKDQKEDAIWEAAANAAVELEEKKMKLEMEHAQKIIDIENRHGLKVEMLKGQIEEKNWWLAYAVGAAVALFLVFYSVSFQNV